jgi:hypothetical protein
VAIYKALGGVGQRLDDGYGEAAGARVAQVR